MYIILFANSIGNTRGLNLANITVKHEVIKKKIAKLNIADKSQKSY